MKSDDNSRASLNVPLSTIIGSDWEPTFYDPAVHEVDFACYPGDWSEFKGKVLFSSADEIPACRKYVYPASLDEIQFYQPPVADDWPILFLDADFVLSNMGVGAFDIHPIRWDKVKSYVSMGNVEYPEIMENLHPMDGRHRTIALIKTFRTKRIPFVCDPSYYNEVLERAKQAGALLD